MIALSRRHAGSVLGLALLAAVPVGYHAVAAPVADSCRDPAALLASERIGGGIVTSRKPAKSGAPDEGYIQGQLPPVELVSSMTFRIVRGSAPSEFYGSDQLSSFDNTFATDDAGEVVALEAGGVRLPVHWLEDTLDPNTRVRAYLYAIDGTPIEHPFAAGLAMAGSQLLHGTRPVTLFVFRADGLGVAKEAMHRAAGDWLMAAWQRHREVCGP